MNKGQRNNSPVNLRYANQTESTGPDSTGFAIFPTSFAGWRAAHAQIALDQKRGLTLRRFIFKFAPPNENNTNAYLEFVAASLSIDDVIPLRSINKYALAGVMAQFEGYYNKEV